MAITIDTKKIRAIFVTAVANIPCPLSTQGSDEKETIFQGKVSYGQLWNADSGLELGDNFCRQRRDENNWEELGTITVYCFRWTLRSVLNIILLTSCTADEHHRLTSIYTESPDLRSQIDWSFQQMQLYKF